jgi:hypothetical protein
VGAGGGAGTGDGGNGGGTGGGGSGNDAASEAAPLPARRLSWEAAGWTSTQGDPGMATAAADECRNGQVIAGFEVSYNTEPPTVHRIAPLCGMVTVTGGASYVISIAGLTKLGARGGTAPNTMTLECPTNQAVVGFHGRSGGLLDQMGLLCAPLLANQDGTVSAGEQTRGPPLPMTAGGSEFTAPCPTDEIAIGYLVNFGAWIDALELRCARASLVP